MVLTVWLKEQLQALGARWTARGSSWQVVIVALLLGALAFLGLAIVRDWETLVSFQWQLDWMSLAKLALMHSLALGTLFLAWHLIMCRLAGLDDWRINFPIYNLSILARRIPTPIWYIGGRLYLYQKQHVPMAIVLSATTLEAALIGLSGVICYMLLLPWYTYVQEWPWWLLLVGAGTSLLALMVRPGLLVDLINLVLHLFKRPPVEVAIMQADLLLWGLVYLATWFLDGIGLYYMVSALLPAPPAIPDVVGIATISALVGLLTLALPSGFGLKELTMGALLSLWMPISAGIVISVLYRLMQTILEMAWALISYLVGRHSFEAHKGP